jgi:hypothetical protein
MLTLDLEYNGRESNQTVYDDISLLYCLSIVFMHMLNMELDLQNLFWLRVLYRGLYSMAETPQLPPSPHIWTHIRGRYWSAKIDDIYL